MTRLLAGLLIGTMLLLGGGGAFLAVLGALVAAYGVGRGEFQMAYLFILTGLTSLVIPVIHLFGFGEVLILPSTLRFITFGMIPVLGPVYAPWIWGGMVLLFVGNLLFARVMQKLELENG
jgi:hypothetical protein